MFHLMAPFAQRFNIIFNVVLAVAVTMMARKELGRAAPFTRSLTETPVQLDAVFIHGVLFADTKDSLSFNRLQLA